jgi:hypothetical protein
MSRFNAGRIALGVPLCWGVSAAAESPCSPDVVAASSVAANGSEPKFTLGPELLGLTTLRAGLELQYLITPQWGVVVYPFYLNTTQDGTADWLELGGGTHFDTASKAFGIDAQLRAYLKGTASSGFFLAPGFEDQRFSTSTRCPQQFERDATCYTQDINNAFTYLGGSLDLGGQVISSNVLVAASFGLHFRHAVGGADEENKPYSWWLHHGPGLRPRFRLVVGVALP